MKKIVKLITLLALALALTLVFTIGWVPVFVVSTVFFVFWGILIVAVILRNRKTR